VSRVLFALGLLISAVVGVTLVADYARFIAQPFDIGEQTRLYEITPGSSFRKVVDELHHQGIIDKPYYWRLFARLQGKASKIKAGHYRLVGRMSPTELLDMFVNGKTVQYSLTLLEGWNYHQVLDAVMTHPEIKTTLSEGEELMALLGQPGMNPEGWFYPETYYFPQGTTDVEFLARSHKLMGDRLQHAWASRADGLPLKTPYEALILASIVEKETAVPDERPMIAAVFLSRLRKGMRLQTDPTVIYGMGDNYDGNIRSQDLRRDTPYNTYLHRGLTPTPIAMPSGAALRAALNPTKTKALYFVAKGDGGHHFSETYQEHRKAVIKYQLGGNASRYKARE
jgi:UPF0755 protein